MAADKNQEQLKSWCHSVKVLERSKCQILMYSSSGIQDHYFYDLFDILVITSYISNIILRCIKTFQRKKSVECCIGYTV